jgi:hypothetical protein
VVNAALKKLKIDCAGQCFMGEKLDASSAAAAAETLGKQFELRNFLFVL